MKAQRRHELKTNALARALDQLPQFSQKHGGKIILVLAALVLVVLLVRYRATSGEQSRTLAADNLALARSSIDDLRDMRFWGFEPQQTVTARNQLIEEARQAIADLSGQTDDPKLLAEAIVARGDLHWVLANLPAMPEATTRPSLGLDQDNDALLKTAEDAYNAVIQQYPQQTSSVVAAHFGLAAIAENRGQWDVAGRHYQAVADNPLAIGAYREQARFRLKNLPTLQEPIYLGQPAPAPTTEPLVLAPELPTTHPAAPTTQAATPQSGE